MTANVSIITSEEKDVLCVTKRALKFTPENNTQRYEQQGLWVVEKGNLKRINIKTGASDDTYTQIITDELNEGAVIANANAKTKNKKQTRMRPPM